MNSVGETLAGLETGPDKDPESVSEYGAALWSAWRKDIFAEGASGASTKHQDELRARLPGLHERYEVWIAEKERAAEEEAREQAAQEQAKEANRRWAGYGVPRRVCDVVDGMRDTQATARVSKWVTENRSDPSSWCLVLSATKGLGKSVAAGYAAKLFAESGTGLLSYWDNREKDQKTLPSWWPISKFARIDSYNGQFEAVCQYPGLIVLDDLGSEYIDQKGWMHQALDAFIDERYSEYRPTLITTNLSAADFRKRYSERICDRLREGGAFFEFSGGSLRGAQ